MLEIGENPKHGVSFKRKYLLSVAAGKISGSMVLPNLSKLA